MTEIVDVAIIGAGPYGLSIAAHLAAENIDLRIFGSAMHTWRTSMPEGMVLKSEGNASSLSDPDSALTIARYCNEHGLPYKDVGLPVPLSTFINYGVEFHRKFVPTLEDKQVASVIPTRYGFDLHLDNGEVARARRVIVAAGIRAYEYLPPQLAHLPPELATHSSVHVKVGHFKDREVAIIGAGASAINLAALLNQVGARVTVVARRPAIDYCGPPTERSLLDRIREPENGLGTGWRSWACCTMPMVFYSMPESFRLMVVRKHLPAAPGWTLKPQVDGIVPVVCGASLGSADAIGDKVRLNLDMREGGQKSLTVDHVIAGTGYRVDMRRLSFLSAPVLDKLDCAENTPRLSRHFESSVPGLHFVGTAAANSFGPMLRFVYGAKFASRRLTGHLSRSLVRGTVTGATQPQQWQKATLAGT